MRVLHRFSTRTLQLDVNPGAAFFAALLALIAAGYSCPTCAEVVRFHIPEGPASSTLRKFAAQSDMNVLFQSDEVSTQRTRAVSGKRERLEALRLMLAGSGLEFRFQEPDSVLVRAMGGRGSSTEGACEQPGIGPCQGGPSKRLESTSIVTIRGLAFDAPYKTGQIPVGVPDITLTREEFERGGFQTVGEVLRSMPQNFGGGLNLGVLFAGGSQNTTSQSAASTMNLRGLGSDSTLVLVNGQRLAASEGSGAVDVTLIPISAVERIDITTGSASALYGSDAVAGVVDIIVRTDFRGVELGSALGYATAGGGFLQHYSVVAGHAFPIVDVFAVVDCAGQHEIDAQERPYIPSQIAGTTVMPGTRRCSEMFSASGSIRDLEMSVLAAFTSRSAYQAEGLTSALGVTSGSGVADVDQYAVNAVIRKHFPRNWTTTFSGGLSVDDILNAEVFSQSGAPDIRESAILDNRLLTAQVVTSGTVVELFSGPMRVAIGAGYNQQDFRFANLPGAGLNLSRQRRVRFAFAESFIPLVPGPSGTVASTRLSVDAAVRAEQYSEVGSATTSKVALIYKPISSVKLQASWGTSFHVPTLLQQFNPQQTLLEVVPDTTQTNGESLALIRFGGNVLLRAERSTDKEVELTLAHESLSSASLRIGYFDIAYHQRIGIPTLDSIDPLSDLSAWPFVIRNPSQAYIREALAQSSLNLTFAPNLPQEATVVVDDRNQNFVRQKASGIDVLGRFGYDSALGQWDTSLNLAYLKLRQQITNETDMLALSGTVYYPPRWRGRFGVSWSYQPFLASLFVNYTGGSMEVSVPGQPPVPAQGIASWTTLDSQIGMSFEGNGHRGKTKVTLSAQNVLNRRPPLISGMPDGVAAVNYDSTNTSPVGRFLTLQFTQAW